MWAFDGGAESEVLDWDTLEEGLTFVLEKLWPQRHDIGKLGSENELIWWCGHFQSCFDGGPTLSAALLKQLGEFGAELFIDCYFSEENPEA